MDEVVQSTSEALQDLASDHIDCGWHVANTGQLIGEPSRLPSRRVIRRDRACVGMS